MRFYEKWMLKRVSTDDLTEKLRAEDLVVTKKTVWVACIDAIARAALHLARIEDADGDAHWIALHLQELADYPRNRAGEAREFVKNDDVDEAELLKLIEELPETVEHMRDRPEGRHEENFWAGNLKTILHLDLTSASGSFSVTVQRAPNRKRASLDVLGPTEVVEDVLRYITSGTVVMPEDA